MTYLHIGSGRLPSALTIVAALVALVGCTESAGPGPVPGGDDFISHTPGSTEGPGGAADAGAAAPEGEGDMAGESPERAIAEADIIQVEGDRLYALSRYSGMTVIDVSDPTDLDVLGRYRSNATPFEMYLRGDVAYVMFNGYPTYVHDEESDTWSWQSASRMQALDVSDPAEIGIIGDHEVPGEISDSRMVGEVLYLVTYENGWCWGCDSTPSTQVSSFDVSDPAAFELVENLRFESEDPSWWKRSITVTTDRMYVAGPSWDSDEGTIQVVDISDPSGDLVLGAEVAIAGQIENRWQMDEHEGVLRVISQPGVWGSSIPPMLETFTVSSASEVTPLAQLEVVLPRPEDLRSVRFDGDRAYAITFERVDPLFTFDLSDPASPRQVGELEIPGWVYHMEPRGDRIYGLGFDDVDGGALHVSLFDVSDLENPTQLDRVNFGGAWAHFAEDQDRIHKAFNLLLDQGLILVPFAGWTDEDCRGRYESGIQLIDVDVAADDLVLRGVAPQIGQARRALLHRGYLFGVSDNAVQVFDIEDRSAPAAVTELEVARNVQQVRVMGDTVLRFGNDWWTGRSQIDFTTTGDADSAEPIGELDLSDAVAEEAAICGGGYWSHADWGSEVFIQGEYAYVPRHGYGYTEGDRYEQTLTFFVVDLGDRTEPRLVGTFAAEPSGNGESLGAIVQTDSALLIGRHSWESDEWRYAYEVFDLRDPEAPTFTTRFEVPATYAAHGWGYGPAGCGLYAPWGWMDSVGGAVVSGDIVASQHAEEIDDGTGRVRYFLDRLDVSDPTRPRMLTPVNIPGEVADFDAETGHVVTLDYAYAERPATDWEDCAGLASRTRLDREEGVCRIYRRRLNTLRLVDGDRASLVDSEMLDGERISSYVAVSGDRVFVMTRDAEGGYYGPSGAEVETLALSSRGELTRLPSVTVDAAGGYWYGNLTARGDRAFISQSGKLHEIDASGDGAPELESHDMPGWSCQSLEVEGDRAYCALGQQGVITLEL